MLTAALDPFSKLETEKVSAPAYGRGTLSVRKGKRDLL